MRNNNNKIIEIQIVKIKMYSNNMSILQYMLCERIGETSDTQQTNKQK